MRGRRQPEIIAGRVNADGSIAAGDGFTVQKGAAGLYTITFAGGFRLVSLTATAMTGTFHIGSLSGFTERSVSLTMFVSTTGAATDAQFSFTATGTQQ
jgi:hypothetical protein